MESPRVTKVTFFDPVNGGGGTVHRIPSAETAPVSEEPSDSERNTKLAETHPVETTATLGALSCDASIETER
jgi:hypothetical protein